MNQLLLGLVLFFGIHSISIVAPALRDRLAAKSELGWKALYTVVSLVGIVLIAKGYADFRQTASILYVPPNWLRHVAALLLIPAFILFLVPYFPGRIKSRIKQPQLVALKTWALAHLFVNGSVADVMLFGTFMLWAVADVISLKRRTPRAVMGAPESPANDFIVVILGLGLYLAFAFWAHEAWIGVAPFAM